MCWAKSQGTTTTVRTEIATTLRAINLPLLAVPNQLLQLKELNYADYADEKGSKEREGKGESIVLVVFVVVPPVQRRSARELLSRIFGLSKRAREQQDIEEKEEGGQVVEKAWHARNAFYGRMTCE